MSVEPTVLVCQICGSINTAGLHRVASEPPYGGHCYDCGSRWDLKVSFPRGPLRFLDVEEEVQP